MRPPNRLLREIIWETLRPGRGVISIPRRQQTALPFLVFRSPPRCAARVDLKAKCEDTLCILMARAAEPRTGLASRRLPHLPGRARGRERPEQTSRAEANPMSGRGSRGLYQRYPTRIWHPISVCLPPAELHHSLHIFCLVLNSAAYQSTPAEGTLAVYTQPSGSTIFAVTPKYTTIYSGRRR